MNAPPVQSELSNLEILGSALSQATLCHLHACYAFQVMIDHVRAPTTRRPVLEVHFQVQLGADAGKGHTLAAALKVNFCRRR